MALALRSSPLSIDLASAPIEDVAAIVRTTLTEQGALQRVRATLRAHVYSALMAAEPRPAAPNLAATSSGKLALAVIDDFLQFHSLESTASTAAVEVIGWSERSLVADAAAELRLPHSQQPLLLQLLEAHLAHAGDAAAGKTAAARRPPVIVAPAPAAPAPLAAAPASPVAALEPAEPPSAASSPLSSSAASMADSALSSSGGGGSVGGGGARARGSTLPLVGGGVGAGATGAVVGAGGAGATGKLLPSLAPLRARDNSGASAEDEWVRDRRLEDEEREAARQKVAAEEAERERASAAKAAAEAEAKAAAEAKAKSDEAERKAADVKRLLAAAEEAKKAEDEKMSARVSGRGMGGGGSLWGEDEKLNAPSSGRRAGGGGGLDAFMAKETEKQQVAERRGATGMGGLDAFMKRQQAASGVSAPESDVLGGGAVAEAPSTSLFTGAAGGARGLPPPVDGRRAPVLSKPGGTEGKPTAARGAAAESELVLPATVPNLAAAPNPSSNASNAAKHAAALAEDSDASIELAGETDDDEDNVGLSRSMGSVGSINSSPGSSKGRVSGVGALGTALNGSSAVTKPRSAFALAAESDDDDDGTVLGPVRAAKSVAAKRPAGLPDTAPKPAFRFDDEPKPKAVYKAPPPPQPTIDDEPAEEVDDIEVISDIEIEDDGGDAW